MSSGLGAHGKASWKKLPSQLLGLLDGGQGAKWGEVGG